MLLQRHAPTFTTPKTSSAHHQKTLALLASISTSISIIFTILVIIGSTNDSTVLANIYFLRIDVSNIIPRTFPNAGLVNSIAQTLGLRDFYQVGLWNYCEGYKGKGVTFCSAPKALYSFDPVTILLSQLLAGAEIAMPASIGDALNMAKAVSHWMFGFYFVGVCFSAVSLAVGWIAYVGHTTPSIVSFLAALFTTLAAVISTALFIVFRSVFEDRPDLNIRGNLGKEMFTFMWMATGFSIVSFILHSSLCCLKRRREKRQMKLKKLVDRQVVFDSSRGSTIVDEEGGSSRGSTATTSEDVMVEKPPEEVGGYIRESQIGIAI